MKTLVRMVFGSKLYGTNTSNSDDDFKSVFLPSAEEILRCEVAHTKDLSIKITDGIKHVKGDIDHRAYSLPYFINLACQGETMALDMLHADDRAWLEVTPIWRELHTFRSMFYTRNLKAFVGYAQHQAAKYGLRGSRLNTCETVLAFLKEQGDKKMGEVWDILPEVPHTSFLEDRNGTKMWVVCGKGMQETAKASHYVGTMERFIQEYGERARLAKENLGVDWKALSHALRAAYQVKHILKHGDYSYPLPETPILIAIKQGNFPYAEVAEMLEREIEYVEGLSAVSSYPEEVDVEGVKTWLTRVMTTYVLEELHAS